MQGERRNPLLSPTDRNRAREREREADLYAGWKHPVFTPYHKPHKHWGGPGGRGVSHTPHALQKKKRQTDRQRERERERQRVDRETERQRDRETDRDTHRQTETDRDGETDRARQRQTNRKQNEAQRNKLQSKPVSMQASKQTNMHACMYTSVHACIHTFLQARIQARKNLHTHVSARTQIHIQSLGSRQKHLPTQQRRPGLEPETSLVNAAAAAYTRGLTGAFEGTQVRAAVLIAPFQPRGKGLSMFRLRLLDFWRDPLNWNFLLGFFWRVVDRGRTGSK